MKQTVEILKREGELALGPPDRNDDKSKARFETHLTRFIYLPEAPQGRTSRRSAVVEQPNFFDLFQFKEEIVPFTIFKNKNADLTKFAYVGVNCITSVATDGPKPSVVIINVKHNYDQQSQRKKRLPCDFWLQVPTILEFLGRTYELCALILHHEEFTNAGHYTSYNLPPTNSAGERRWVYIDDDRVEQLGADDIPPQCKLKDEIDSKTLQNRKADIPYAIVFRI
jgi:hypothetical protein